MSNEPISSASTVDCKVRITFDSDWHVGSGTGRPGQVDRLLARDSDDLPYVPAKTLTGIWRDACERLAVGLDDGAESRPWSAWLRSLIGSQPNARGEDTSHRPTPSAVSIRSAHLPGSIRHHLGEGGRAELRSALTFVKAGVMINHETGRAKDDHLRFVEMGRAGTVLEADLTLAVATDERQIALDFLGAAAILVERLGGKRRRGSGRCRLEIVGQDLNAAINRLAASGPPISPDSEDKPDDPPDTPEASEANGPPKDDWVRIPLRLTLRSPLAVFSKTVGNVVESLDFLPGTYLLPWVSQFLKSERLNPGPAIASGEIRVLPATVEVDGHRGLPVPMALFRHKIGGGFEAGGTVLNRFAEAESSTVQLKGMRGGFIGPCLAGTYPVGRETRDLITVRTHNTVEDVSQRPNEDVGGVYSYEAIAAGTVLRSELLIRKSIADLLPERWGERIPTAARLGRSSKDDYGRVDIEPLGPPPDTPQVVMDGTRIVVWLTSDLLLRDENLRPDPSLSGLKKALGTAIGVSLEDFELEGLLTAQIRTRRIESWHVGWGLPRPTLLAMAAGSCAVFEVIQDDKSPIDLEALNRSLTKVQSEGLGERRGEGYGQVRFNDPLTGGSIGDWEPTPKPKGPGKLDLPASIPRDDEGRDLAEVVEKEAWRKLIQVRTAILATARSSRESILGWIVEAGAEGERAKSKPPMSQIGGLRVQLSRIRTVGDADGVINWLAHVQQKRADRWPKATDKGPSAIEKIEAILRDKGAIWKILGSEAWPVLTDDGRERLQDSLWVEAVRSLVESAMKSQKRDLENPSKATNGAR